MEGIDCDLIWKEIGLARCTCLVTVRMNSSPAFNMYIWREMVTSSATPRKKKHHDFDDANDNEVFAERSSMNKFSIHNVNHNI